MKNKHFHIGRNNEHLSQSDLWAYSRADLGVEEMYRLELHLIECDFCSEALEGLEMLPEGTKFDQMIESINKKVVPSTKHASRTWMLVAASISLIALSTLSIWFLNSESTPEPIAQQIEQTVPVETPKNETVIIEEKEVDAVTEQPELAKVEGKAIEIEPESKDVMPEIEQISKLDTEAIGQSIPDTSKFIAADDEEIQGVQSMEMSEDSNQAIARRAKAVESEPRTSLSKKNTAIAPAAADQNVTEEPAAEAAPIDETRDKDLSDYTSPTPVAGNNALKKYIRKNLRYPERAKQNNIKGEVELSIRISASGAIKSITIVNSLGYGCDEEAIRLIRNGPLWAPAVTNNQPIEATVQVKVKFRP